MLAKNLTFLAKADAAGIVLGARVPIILTSRADSVRSRHGIRRGRRALRRCPPKEGGGCRRVKPMDAILVVNAGSSSLKFQVFATGASGDLDRLVKGQMDGIGTRPRLRAAGPDKKPLIDQSYPVEKVPDLPAATAGNRRLAT